MVMAIYFLYSNNSEFKIKISNKVCRLNWSLTASMGRCFAVMEHVALNLIEEERWYVSPSFISKLPEEFSVKYGTCYFWCCKTEANVALFKTALFFWCLGSSPDVLQMLHNQPSPQQSRPSVCQLQTTICSILCQLWWVTSQSQWVSYGEFPFIY